MRFLRMFGLIIVGTVAVFMFQINMQKRGQPAAPPVRNLDTVTTFETSPAFTRAQMEAALAQLKTSCAPLFTDYADDVEWIKVMGETDDCNYPGSHRCDEYGWDRTVEINVKIVDDRKVIPVDYRARGHTLFYWLGTGRRPGIMSLKDQSKFVCEWSHIPDSSNYFVSVPKLADVLPASKEYPIPKKSHYVMREKDQYGYKQNDGVVKMVRYLGKHDGKYQLVEDINNSEQIVYQCQFTCDYFDAWLFVDGKLTDTRKLKADPWSPIWTMVHDAKNGVLDQTTLKDRHWWVTRNGFHSKKLPKKDLPDKKGGQWWVNWQGDPSKKPTSSE